MVLYRPISCQWTRVHAIDDNGHVKKLEAHRNRRLCAYQPSGSLRFPASCHKLVSPDSDFPMTPTFSLLPFMDIGFDSWGFILSSDIRSITPKVQEMGRGVKII